MSDVSSEVKKDVVYMGRTNFRNQAHLFGIKRRDRRQHMYVVGKSGTGKSVLIHNMILQDIANGEGVCMVDPHGENVEDIIRQIPEHRLKDVVYFNPADTDHPIGFNVLELPDTKYKHLVASGLMSIFTKIWSNVWSARMEYILNNAILALLDTPGSTLLGITRILVDKDFRQKIVANVKDPVVRGFWIHEYEEWQDKFRNEAIAPIQNKVGQFLSTSIIRNVVGQATSTINIFDIMNEKKIFLVNVSKGRLGEDNSALIGAMIVTKIQLSAMERVRIPEAMREDFYLYVDEFQNFATDSFASILSEARKYRLNLIIVHQYIGQLVSDNSTRIRDAIFGNAGTMVTFRVGAQDAEFLEKDFEPEFLPLDLIQLPNYEILLKLLVDGVTSRPFSAGTLPPFHLPESGNSETKVIDMSRTLYARQRKTIEDEISRWAGSAPIGRDDSYERPPMQGGGGERRGPAGDRGEGRPEGGGGYERREGPRNSQRDEARQAAHLAAIGIEFAEVPDVPKRGPAPRQDNRGPASRRASVQHGERSERPMSLDELSKKRDAREVKRPEKGGRAGNSQSLRDALKFVMGSLPQGKPDENKGNNQVASQGG